MAQFEESSVAILEKQKQEEDIEIKWPFWDDLNFLRASLPNSHEYNLVWMISPVTGFSSSVRPGGQYTFLLNLSLFSQL